MNYYDKNKEKIKKQQLEYYHKYKNNPNKSHFLQNRLKLQRDKYKEKYPNCKIYNKHIKDIKLNYDSFIVSFK